MSRCLPHRLPFIAGVLALVSAGQAAPPVQVSSQALNPGVCSETFVTHRLEHTTTVPGGDTVRMFEANGGGAGLGDLDRDGDLDIVLANHAGTNSILWNEGGLSFRPEALPIGDSRAVTLIDLDGDGWLDLVFSRRASAPNYFHNAGGSFVLEPLGAVARPLYAINWADLDGDNDLDLVGGSYDAGLLNDLGQSFLASGDGGVFVYTNTGSSFTEMRLSDRAQALALLLVEVSGDERPDILVGNDFAVLDMVWINSETGWSEAAPFAVTTHSTMSLDMGDVDNDGQAELFATDMKPYRGEAEAPWQPVMETMMGETHPEGEEQVMENVLQIASGDGFANEAARRGVDGSGWSWSAKFGDLDQDGLLDLYVVNGMMEATTFAHLENHELVEENQAFRNRGEGMFEPAPAWGLGSSSSGRGMSMGDLDGDGDLDIVVNNLRSPAQLFENQLCGGEALLLDLLWPGTKNTRALGSVVTLHTDRGSFRRDVRAGSGYLSSDPARLHFGVPVGAILESLEVRWPDGEITVLDVPESNILLTLERRADE